MKRPFSGLWLFENSDDGEIVVIGFELVGCLRIGVLGREKAVTMGPFSSNLIQPLEKFLARCHMSLITTSPLDY